MNGTRRQQLKDEFIRTHGCWSEHCDGVLELDPAYFQAFMDFSAVPWKTGPLSPKVKELIYVAIDGATTHLFESGLRIHMANALRLGVTSQELMEVLELSSVLGIHTATVGVPILLQELAAAGQMRREPIALSAREATLKDEFITVRGYWSELWDGVLALDPDFFEAYLRFSAVPFEQGVLEPKIRELIYIAVDASTTHLFEPGIRIHMRNAIAHGATGEEIMEVLELTSVLGVHTVNVGAPILLEESARADIGAQTE
jgi:alkylhydroperoxidase/carboxymuconolactone decarboxylase family protein YurZ